MRLRGIILANRTVIRLYPEPCEQLPLEGLYLNHALHRSGSRQHPFVYTNFVSSLDGRIAIEHASGSGTGVPTSIANPRDWRLFQELVAQSDILITSARYLRELTQGEAQSAIPLSNDPAFDDLHSWRHESGLPDQPALVILSASLDLPLQSLCEAMDRPVYVATGDNPDSEALKAIQGTGARVLHAGNGGAMVDGKKLIDVLAAEGFRSIYSIAGPGVFETLINAHVLDRLYLTQVHRLIGGDSFDTLLEGNLIDPPADFEMRALYYDHIAGDVGAQLFGVYDTVSNSGKQVQAG
jgi:riboflavin biosynthesis pyrimidine reductase